MICFYHMFIISNTQINQLYTANHLYKIGHCGLLSYYQGGRCWHAPSQAAFRHDYECVKQDAPCKDHLLRVLPRCFTEVELRLANPLRSIRGLPRNWFKNGAKGVHYCFASETIKMYTYARWIHLKGIQSHLQTICKQCTTTQISFSIRKISRNEIQSRKG